MTSRQVSKCRNGRCKLGLKTTSRSHAGSLKLRRFGIIHSFLHVPGSGTEIPMCLIVTISSQLVELLPWYSQLDTLDNRNPRSFFFVGTISLVCFMWNAPVLAFQLPATARVQGAAASSELSPTQFMEDLRVVIAATLSYHT